MKIASRGDLLQKSTEDLQKRLIEVEKQLTTMILEKKTSGSKDTNMVGKLKKERAIIYTLIAQKKNA